jgi:hypothetical protein
MPLPPIKREGYPWIEDPAHPLWEEMSTGWLNMTRDQAIAEAQRIELDGARKRGRAVEIVAQSGQTVYRARNGLGAPHPAHDALDCPGSLRRKPDLGCPNGYPTRARLLSGTSMLAMPRRDEDGRTG